MSIKTIKRMGEASLLEKSLPVTNFNCPALDQLIEDMKDSMAEKNGVGIAAPQIGVNQRVMIFGFEKSVRYPNEKPVPFTVLINPVVEILSEEMEERWEGCLSIPGLRGLVPRYTHIRYSGQDQHGSMFSREATHFHARIIQHEVDHLDGILFPRRIRDLRYFGFEEVMATPLVLENAGL